MFNFNRKEKGQGLVEYALILVLVAVIVIVVLQVLGPLVGSVFTNINNGLTVSSAGGGEAAAEPTADPAAESNAAFQKICDNRSWAAGTSQTWPSGDVVVYLQNDGMVYTRFSDDPYFTTNAGDVVENYGTIPAGTTVTCQ